MIARNAVLWALACTLLLPLADARAQSTRKVEKLAKEGLHAFDAGEYERALSLYRKAHEIQALPKLSFAEARCLEALGRLKEAKGAIERALQERPGRSLRRRLDQKLTHYEERLRFGRLALSVDVAGAEVVVGGKTLGMTPLAPIELPVGVHDLRIRHTDREDLVRQVDIRPGEDTRLTLTMERAKGKLLLQVQPAGARVAIDGVPRGRAPLSEPLALAPGPHVVEISLGGHQSVRRTVVVASGGTDELHVELVGASGSWYRSAAGWVLLGSGLAIAATGAGLVGYSASERSAVRTAVETPLSTTSSQRDLFDRSEAAQAMDTAGWVLVGAGSAATVAAVVVFAVRASRGDDQRDATVSVWPVISPRRAGVALAWGF